MSRNWTAEEYREYLRTGKEPREESILKTARDIVEAYRNPTPQEEIERRYAEAERRGEVQALDITEYLDGTVTMELVKPEKKAKYRNEPETVNGIRFSSKHEARVYMELLERVRAGELKCVCRQVGFDLPGGIRYYADFVTVDRDNRIEVIDAKSEITKKNRVYINKKKQMAACNGIEIREI